MKILHIVWGMENGGAENMLADIINTQVCTDDVSLLVINDMLDSSILERINKKCKFKNSILVNNGINFELIKTRDDYMSSGTFKIVQVSRILYSQKGKIFYWLPLPILLNLV